MTRQEKEAMKLSEVWQEVCAGKDKEFRTMVKCPVQPHSRRGEHRENSISSEVSERFDTALIGEEHPSIGGRKIDQGASSFSELSFSKKRFASSNSLLSG
jgi:hypothetical protein